AGGSVPPGRRPPPFLRGVELRSASLPGVPALGLLEDRRCRRRLVVLRVRGSGFTLSDAEEQARQVARWGEALAVLGRAASPIDRVQWIEVAAPEDGDGPKRYLMEAGRRPEVPDPLLRSYVQLLERSGTVTEHETLVVLGLNLGRMRRAGPGEAERVLLQQVQALAGQLGGEVQVEGVLSPRLLALAVRSAFDPEARLARSRAERAGQEAGARPEGIWPTRVVEGVGHLEVEGWWHASYWVVELPRSPVGPTFAVPLLLQTTCHRRVAMVVEVRPPAASLRRVERRRTLEQVNRQVKARLGFLAGAAEELREAEVEATARELAMGQVLARFAITVTVSGRSAAELEEACREVEQQAALAGIELQRCWGDQRRAFLATLPLCRGLPERG
ncbi:MAG TPA: SCO6880 family protein, partial [Acidimicrobiales bacterium]|nr:SCO6880 family protein [Acidimicrobiales bacterium]